MEYHLTMKDVKKYEILKQVIAKELKGKEAALLPGYHRSPYIRFEKEGHNLRDKGHPAP